MFFDDRLATVLRQRAQSDAMRRTQFRQLLDLLGSPAGGAQQSGRDPSLVAAAWLRMDSLADAIPASDRARLISEPGWRLRNPELAAHLADFEPEVVSATLARAQLSAEDWNALIPRLPVRARGFLRLRRDLPVEVETTLERLGVYDRGLPQPEIVAEGMSPETPRDAFLGEDIAEDEPAPQGSSPASPEPEQEPEEAPEEAQKEGLAETGDTPPVPREPIFFSKDTQGSAEDALLADVGGPAEARTSDRLPATSRSQPASQEDGRSEISALVERIARFKRNREEASPPREGDQQTDFAQGQGLMPRLPLGEDEHRRLRLVQGFGFVADAAGRIEWAENDVASMVMGMRLIAPTRSAPNSAGTALSWAFTRRQPIAAAPLSLDGAPQIAGNWIVDAQPRFTEVGGFAGYVGRMRRALEEPQEAPTPAQNEADRIRQLLHELRTPVTAVQGYSEVIQQQLFGSAPHEYRALAASIASDAARILSGFEELDRLARLETGALEVEPGQTDVLALTNRVTRQLAQVLDARMAGIALEPESQTPHFASIGQDSAESLLWRLLATLGGGCAAGESLTANLESHGKAIALSCDLPMQLLVEDDLFAADARPISSAINPGLFGAGFALRLARAEARAAGGDLRREQERLVLTLPQANEDDCDAAQDFALEP